MLYGDFDSVELCRENHALYAALKFWRDQAATTPDGRHELGDGIFAMIKSFAPKPREERRYETHVQYADIQCVLEGDETIYVRPPEGLKVQEDFLAERDVVFYNQPEDCIPEQPFLMLPGHFLLLCPEDAHKPECLTSFDAGRKIVLKVPMVLLR